MEHPVLLQGSSDALSFHPDWLTRAPTMMTARGIPNHTPVTHSQDSPSSSTLCLQSISSTDATGWTNCATCLNKSCNEVCASKSEEDHALVLKLLDVIYKAKGEGITVSHLLVSIFDQSLAFSTYESPADGFFTRTKVQHHSNYRGLSGRAATARLLGRVRYVSSRLFHFSLGLDRFANVDD